MKVFKTILLTITKYILVVVLTLIIGFLLLWFISFSLTVVNFIPNENSIFYDIASINFSDFISAVFVSFMICVSFMFVCLMALTIFKPRFSSNVFSKLNRFLWTLITALFLTLTLIFWLDEKGFMIATSIVSFFALLFPLSKRFWDNPSSEQVASKEEQLEKRESE